MRNLLLGITAALIFSSGTAFAADNDMTIIDLYNKYRASIYVAEICPVEKLTAEQDDMYRSNFMNLSLEAKRAFRRLKAGSTEQDATESFRLVDQKIRSDLNGLYKAEGCKNNVLVQVIKWRKDFANIKPAEEPKAAAPAVEPATAPEAAPAKAETAPAKVEPTKAEAAPVKAEPAPVKAEAVKPVPEKKAAPKKLIIDDEGLPEGTVPITPSSGDQI